MAAPRNPTVPTGSRTCVGRGDAITELDRVVEATARGRGGLVLITGERGIGKTTLASEMFERASAAGLMACWSSCWSQTALPPYWPWSQLVSDCLGQVDPAAAAELSAIVHPVLPGLDPTVPAPAGSAPAAGSQLSLFQTMVRFWALAARARPILLVIDDLQWAQPESVQLIAHLSTALRHLPVVLIAIVRTGEPTDDRTSTALSALDELRPLTVPLRGLSRVALAELLVVNGFPADSAMVELLAARTAGNPLFATELLRMLDREVDRRLALEALATEVPRHVARVVQRRLGPLDPAVRDLLAAAAVIGPNGDAEVLAASGADDTDRGMQVLDLAVDLGLLVRHGRSGWRFVHTIVRDVVYADLTPALRRHLYERVAEASPTSVAPPTPSDWQGRYALGRMELGRAVQLVIDAGSEHLRRGQFNAACDCFARAIELSPQEQGTAVHAGRLVLLGQAHRGAGHTAPARAAFRAAINSPAAGPDLLGAAALGFADATIGLDLNHIVVDDEVHNVLQRALDTVGPAATPLRVRLMVRLSLETFYAGSRKKSLSLIDDALAVARPLGDPILLVEAMAVRHVLHVVGRVPPAVALDEATDIMTVAHTAGDPATRRTARQLRLFDLLIAGDLIAVDAEIVALNRLASQLGDAPGHQWWMALWQGMRALLAGRHLEAEEFAAEAWRMADPVDASEAGVNRLIQHVFIRREQARLAELDQEVRQFAASTPYSPVTDTLMAFRAAERGQLDEAADALRRLYQQLDALRDHRDWPGLWFQLARTAYLVGDRELSGVLYGAGVGLAGQCVLISLAAACGGAADLALAWLADALRDGPLARRWYTSAEAINVRIDAQPWLAQTRVDHARLLARTGASQDLPEAVRLAALAGDAAERIGLAAVLADAQTVLDGLNPAITGPAVRPTTVDEGDVSFRRDGALWRIGFDGRAIGLPHAKGLADLHLLVSQPGEPRHVSELVSLQAPGVSVDHGADEIFDTQARQEIRRRLADLADEAEEAQAHADLGRAERARTERAELVAALSSALGLGGRARRLNDPMERARKTVGARIRSSISRIGLDHPSLARHFERSVDTGLWCVYQPEQPIHWLT